MARRGRQVSYEPGHIFHKANSTFELVKVLDVRENKKGGRFARWVLVRCIDCGTEREALLASMTGNGGCICKACGSKTHQRSENKPPIHYPTHEEKISIMAEINQIFEEMKRLAREGKLISYIVAKFNDRNGVDYYLEDVTQQPIDPVEDIDMDEEVDWDAEINKLLDNDED